MSGVPDLTAGRKIGMAGTNTRGGDPMATPEENKAVIRRFYDEVLNKGNLALADEMLSDDFVDRSPVPGQASDREGFKQVIAMFHAAFPDVRLRIEDLVMEGDRGVVRDTFTGTQRGELMGIPATDKRVEFGSIHIGRFVGGKVAEHWVVWDTLGMMQQLGVVPAPGQS